MTLRLGIDEAGRGCVLGPMVFGACLVEASDEEELRQLGVRDSKKLSPRRRQELRQELESRAEAWRCVELQPILLDAYSLNDLGKQVVVELYEELRPDVLVLDAPVPPRQIPAYVRDIERRLRERGLTPPSIVAENGADDTHPCCAASSIFAKTTRDTILADLEAEAGQPLGSGYPSDPRTRAFLESTWREHAEWPSFVRTKWETVRRIVAESSQARLL